MTHQHPSHADAATWRHTSDELVQHLTIESSLSQPVIATAVELIEQAVGRQPSVAIDLGSGTGAGTIALAKRFPDLTVHSADFSQTLLAHLLKVSAEQGLSGQVQAHQVDIDGPWVGQIPRKADIVWASLSLHHVANPAKALRQVFEVLRPGGVLAMIEMARGSQFSPPDLGVDLPGVAEKVRLLEANRGFPSEQAWQRMLDQAGFASVRHLETGFTVDSTTEQGRQYLRHQIERVARAWGDAPDLPAHDALQAAAHSLSAGDLPLSVYSARSIWIATKL